MSSTATLFRVTEQDKVPGPGAYDVPTDFGKEACKYSIKNRYKDSRKNGPGYENVKSTVGEGKQYSLRSRHKEPKPQVAPGPTYIPPSIIADARSSAFHIRGDDKVRTDSPGPGKYNTRKKNDGKQFTMKSRKFVEEKDCSPGPKYMPNYNPTLPSAQSNSIHDVIRRKDQNDVPGPGRYDIDRSMESGPASFHRRCESARRNDVPGPGKYEPEKHQPAEAPSWSLRSRCDVPDKSTKAPYQKLPDAIGQGLKYSLTSRRDSKMRDAPPGPDYVPPPFGSDGRKYSFKSRHEKKRDVSKEPPGPGEYDVRKENGGKKYTMKGRNFWNDEGKAISPGPAYLPDYNGLYCARKTTIYEKTKDHKNQAGPGYYDLGSTLGQGPKITIGNKEKLAVRPGLG